MCVTCILMLDCFVNLAVGFPLPKFAFDQKFVVSSNSSVIEKTDCGRTISNWKMNISGSFMSNGSALKHMIFVFQITLTYPPTVQRTLTPGVSTPAQ